MTKYKALSIKIALTLTTLGCLICVPCFLKAGFIFYSLIAYFSLSVCALAIIDCEIHTHAFRIIYFAALCVAVVGMIYIILERYGITEKLTNFESVKGYILSTKQWGWIIFILLTVFQVVVLPIPAALTILIGVAIYGAWMSFVLSYIGTMIGSWIAFALGKIFGRRLVAWLIGQENTDKYAKLLNDKGKLIFIAMLVLPAFPDDMLCIVAGITTMSYLSFTVICLFSRPIMIAVTCFLGDGSLIPFDGWGIPIWIGIISLTISIILFFSLNKKLLMRTTSRKKSLENNKACNQKGVAK